MSAKFASKAGAKIVERKLSNGLKVLLVERHAAPVVSVLLYYRVGVRTELEHEAGMSHFLEHMMFKGTSKYGKGQIDLVTTMLGGNNNAFTGYDHTGYWFEFASDRWERALELEADRMNGLLIDADEFEAEKAVVLEELSMTEDDPWRELTREMAEMLYPGHCYGRPVIGYAETLRQMTPADMDSYYRRHYRPSNAMLVVCGDFKERGAMSLVRKHFGAIDANGVEEAAPSNFRRALTEPRAEKRVVCRWDDDARRLCMAWPTTAVGTDEDWAFDLLNVVLASGRLSRLHQRLVQDERLATSVSMSNDARVDGGAVWLYAECAQSATPEALEAAIDEELERLAVELISAKELSRARAIFSASEAHENETVTDLAEDIGSYAIDIDWRMALEGRERLAAVRPRFIRDTVRKFLRRDRRVVGWSLPAGDPSLLG
ncbi:MAG: zinc protease [Planctomycetota bacterium]